MARHRVVSEPDAYSSSGTRSRGAGGLGKVKGPIISPASRYPKTGGCLRSRNRTSAPHRNQDVTLADGDSFEITKDKRLYRGIPEPSTLAIWSVLGLVGLALAHRRRS